MFFVTFNLWKKKQQCYKQKQKSFLIMLKYYFGDTESYTYKMYPGNFFFLMLNGLKHQNCKCSGVKKHTNNKHKLKYSSK